MQDAYDFNAGIGRLIENQPFFESGYGKPAHPPQSRVAEMAGHTYLWQASQLVSEFVDCVQKSLGYFRACLVCQILGRLLNILPGARTEPYFLHIVYVPFKYFAFLLSANT